MTEYTDGKTLVAIDPVVHQHQAQRWGNNGL